MRRNAVRQAVQSQPVGRPPRQGVVFADDIPEYVTGRAERTPGRRIFPIGTDPDRITSLPEDRRRQLMDEAYYRAINEAEAVDFDEELDEQEVQRQRQRDLQRRRSLKEERDAYRQRHGFGKRKGVLKRLQMDLAKLKKV
jgi:hypothetical protein